MSGIRLVTKGILSGSKEAPSGDLSLRGVSSGTSTASGKVGYITNLLGTSSGMSSTTILLQVFNALQENLVVEVADYSIMTNLFGQIDTIVEVADHSISTKIISQEVDVEVEPIAIFAELLEA